MSVLGDERIILPIGIISRLEDNGIKKILVGKLPGYKALILCPEALWGRWLNKIRRMFPCLKNHDGARTFIIPWQPVQWDTKGRISLPKQARDYAAIREYDPIIILGINYYFEL